MEKRKWCMVVVIISADLTTEVVVISCVSQIGLQQDWTSRKDAETSPKVIYLEIHP